MKKAALKAHFLAQGAAAGLTGSRACLARKFVALMPPQPALEIGPFGRPRIRGDHVAYFDVMDQAALMDLARSKGRPHEDCPPIEFVSSNGDLSVVTRRFRHLFASHALEHQPNLIRHLRQAESLLLPGGAYWLVLPDKRYCFDHFRSLTTAADVLGAWAEDRRVHALGHVFEHRALTTHNDAARHWAGDHGAPNLTRERIEGAMEEIRRADGGYIDVHAWRFTPDSFRDLITLLADLGLTRFRPARVYNTPRDRQEFCAVLTVEPGA